jgi:hypothetical protein
VFSLAMAPVSTIFKNRPCGITVRPFVSKIDRNAWYASATVTFCGEYTLVLMLRTLPPKMNRFPVSCAITRTSSFKSASSRENATL